MSPTALTELRSFQPDSSPAPGWQAGPSGDGDQQRKRSREGSSEELVEQDLIVEKRPRRVKMLTFDAVGSRFYPKRD